MVTVIVLVGAAPVPEEPQAVTAKAATEIRQLAASSRGRVIVDALIVNTPSPEAQRASVLDRMTRE